MIRAISPAIARRLLWITFALLRPLGFLPGGYFNNRDGCRDCIVRLDCPQGRKEPT